MSFRGGEDWLATYVNHTRASGSKCCKRAGDSSMKMLAAVHSDLLRHRRSCTDNSTASRALEHFDKAILSAGWIFTAEGQAHNIAPHKGRRHLRSNYMSHYITGGDEACDDARARGREPMLLPPLLPPHSAHWLTASMSGSRLDAPLGAVEKEPHCADGPPPPPPPPPPPTLPPRRRGRQQSITLNANCSTPTEYC